MKDIELIKKLDIDKVSLAKALGIGRATLYRKLSEIELRIDEESKSYLNAGRLVNLWLYFSKRGDVVRANAIRLELLDRHPQICAITTPDSVSLRSA